MVCELHLNKAAALRAPRPRERDAVASCGATGGGGSGDRVYLCVYLKDRRPHSEHLLDFEHLKDFQHYQDFSFIC